MSALISHAKNAYTRFPFRASLRFLTLMLLMAGSPSRASVGTQFIGLPTFSSGGTPVSLASADFNRDGKPDVVALNSNGVLSILLGDGKGGFAAAQTIATLTLASGAPAPQLATGDFNGDGNTDLLILQSPGNVVTAYPGRGNGTFEAPLNFANGLASAGNLAVGDFNGDGRPDVAVADSASVAILLGKPGGFFEAPIVTGTNLVSTTSLLLALGDVNRDGHLDVVATDQGGSFQVLLGNGRGGFAPATSTFSFTDLGTNSLAIADFNGDGKPDLAAGLGAGLPQFFNGEVCLLFGNGDGTFDQNSPQCYGAPDSFDSMLVTDLNGRPGLILPSDPIYTVTTSASGAVTETRYAAGGGPVALGDFNGDGRQDIATGNSGGVQVLLNAGGGVLRAPIDVLPPGSFNVAGASLNLIISMNTTDFNHDGFADLAVAEGYDDHGFLIPSMGTLLGAPSNQLHATSNTPLPFTPPFGGTVAPLAIGDFNHDGHLDIAYSATYYSADEGYSVGIVQVLFGDGKGRFPAIGPASSIASNFIAAGYFNGDGHADLATLDGTNLEILIGNGDGTFKPPVTYTVGTSPVFVLQRDLNGDGKRDLVVVNHDSDNISVLLGNGDGTFKPQKTFGAGTLPNWAVTGDFNRDGKIDIAVASNSGISILLGNGDGTFQPERNYPAAGTLTAIAQASVRQDGIECLLGIDSASNRFVLLPGAGDGTFGAPVFFHMDRVPTSILAGDFNADGATDIALLANGHLEVFYNQGGDHVTLSSSSTSPKANQAVTLLAQMTSGFGEMGMPSGKVTFKDGTKFLGTASLHSGSAALTIHLPAGTHRMMAEYAGDSAFNPNHSSIVTIVVAP